MPLRHGTDKGFSESKNVNTCVLSASKGEIWQASSRKEMNDDLSHRYALRIPFLIQPQHGCLHIP